MNPSNRTILTYFGGKDNFIFKIVLLDGPRCMRPSVVLIGLTSLAGLLQTNPVDICRAQFRGSIIRLVAMVLGYYPWYTSKRIESWAHCDLINHKFCQERSFWYYTSSQFEIIWFSPCAQLCHRACGFGMQFFRDSYPIPKIFEILI